MNKSPKILLVFLLSISFKAYTQVDTIVWQQLSPLPVAISSFEVGHFLIDSDFYIAGGWIGDAEGVFSNMVWRYHIPTDSWYQMGNLPFGGAASSCSFASKGKGYFLTARDSTQNFNCDNMLWMYDPTTDAWTRLADFPDIPRQNSSSFEYCSNGYVGQTYGCGLSDNHFWKFNPALNQWTAIASLSTNTNIIGGSDAIVSLPASVYLLCGFNQSAYYNDIFRYNILGNYWDSIGQMPGYGRAYGFFWGFDSLIIGGGGTNDSTWFNDYYRYNISQNLWTKIVFQNFIDSTFGGVPFIYNQTGYYFGGTTDLLGGSINSGMWSFDASRFFPPDSPTGIAPLKSSTNFSLYPNPSSHEQGFSVSTSDSGDISFYDALGRLLDERKLQRGITPIKLSTDDEVIFYKASLSSGEMKNGKVVFLK